MTKIFDNNALNILPLPSGFIVAFCKDDEGTEGKMVVAYSLVSFRNETVSPVTRSVYQLAKFGQCYKLIESQLENPFYWKTIFLQGDMIFCYYPDGSAKIFDSEARVKWEGKLMYEGKGAAEVVLQGGSLWASFPESGCISKINIKTMREELRIGGENSAFLNPTGMFLEEDRLYVCNSGDGKVWEINTNNFAVSEYLSFDEPVHQFIKINEVVLVRLDAGVYKM